MEELVWREFPTPHGKMVAMASADGLVSLYWGEPPTGMREDSASVHLNSTEKWVRGYFRGEVCDLPRLDLSSLTEFAQKVSHALIQTTPHGERVTYRALAEFSGSPRASRAVGSVMTKNPFSLIVPCHRVIRTDGKIGNYSAAGGSETKEWLLNFESEL